ncbi:MAG: hypothetical protein ACRDRO_18865 [Pseudonocardiaceae bacterium]
MTDRAAWMRTQFDHAARRHGLTPDGPTRRGVRDRTISGRVTNHETTRWLRVIAVATDQAHGVVWDGPIAATEIAGVRRPELLTAEQWTLYCTSLLVPEVAATVYHQFRHVLDTPDGRIAQLGIGIQLGRHHDCGALVEPLRQLAHRLTLTIPG